MSETTIFECRLGRIEKYPDGEICAIDSGHNEGEFATALGEKIDQLQTTLATLTAEVEGLRKIAEAARNEIRMQGYVSHHEQMRLKMELRSLLGPIEPPPQS